MKEHRHKQLSLLTKWLIYPLRAPALRGCHSSNSVHQA